MVSLFKKAQHVKSTVPDILPEAEHVANTVMSGLHGKKSVGSGEAFWQFKPYETGMDIAQIDWKQSAKRDAPFIKQREWDVAQTYIIDLPPTPSMRYAHPSQRYNKITHGAIIALALCLILNKQGERFTIAHSGISPGFGARKITMLTDFLETVLTQENGEHTHHTSQSPFGVSHNSNKNHIPIFINDFLDIPSQFPHYNGLVIQTLDPSELTFPFKGRYEFKMDQNQAQPRIFEKSEALRAPYQSALRNHIQKLETLFEQQANDYFIHRTDEDKSALLLDVLMALKNRNHDRGFAQ